jgi:hypothetical protein
LGLAMEGFSGITIGAMSSKYIIEFSKGRIVLD